MPEHVIPYQEFEDSSLQLCFNKLNVTMKL